MREEIKITGSFLDVTKEDKRRKRLKFWIHFITSWYGFDIEDYGMKKVNKKGRPLGSKNKKKDSTQKVNVSSQTGTG